MRVLVVGDACIDEYRFGEIRRLNPESSAPLVSVVRVEERPGMACNVAQNLTAMGAKVEGHFPAAMSRKIRYIDQRTGEHLLRVDADVRADPYPVPEVLDYDAVVISDYDKGFLGYDEIQTICERFHGPIYMDTKKTDLARFKDILIKVNQAEYERAISYPLEDNIIVTCGSAGARYMNKMYPANKIDVVDVCGAGDVFLAALVFKYLETGQREQAIEFANLKAGESCSKVGTVCVS